MRIGAGRGRIALAIAVGSLVFLIAILPRIRNSSVAIVRGVPQFAPFDELYQARRIAYSASHSLKALTFDPEVGVSGAFCPWPPLYPLVAGNLARLSGARTPDQVLLRAAWFPPIAVSVLVAALAAFLTVRYSTYLGLISGIALATNVPWLDKSRIASIDHHFLEPALVLGILAGVLLLRRASTTRGTVLAGVVFALLLSVALFVQVALITAAGLAMVAVLLMPSQESRSRWAAALGFAVTAVALVIAGLSQRPGYPNDEWHLGWPHVAAILGAAAAIATQAVLYRRGGKAAATGVALVVGALVVLAIPGSAWAFLGGSRFFGGDPWLASIDEFQPLFGGGVPPLLDFLSLGAGALLIASRAADSRWRAGDRVVLLLFAGVYGIAAISARRFLVIASPLLALGGAWVVSDIRERSPRRAMALCALLLLPNIPLVALRMLRPSRPVPAWASPAFSAAQFVRSRPEVSGRALPPWSWGHLVHIVGGRAVLIDNFGTMLGRVPFENATGILFSPSEEAVFRFCEANDVRYIILENPAMSLETGARIAGFPPAAYARGGEPTRLGRASFWWRTYFSPDDSAFHRFRRVHGGSEPAGIPEGERGSIQVWERL